MIELKNERIINFYSKYKNLDIVQINIQIIDLYEKMFENMTEENSNKISTEILLNIKSNGFELEKLKNELKTNIEIYKTEISNIKTINSLSNTTISNELSNITNILNKLNLDITNSVISKFYDIRNSYTEDLKTIINTNGNDNLIKILNKLENDNISLITKTTNIIGDIIPKSQLEYYTQYNSTIKEFKMDINRDIETIKNEIKENKSDVSLDKLTILIGDKYNNLLSSVQTNVLSYLNVSEQRLKDNINEIKDEKGMRELKDDINQKIEHIKHQIQENKSDVSLDKLNLLIGDKYNNLLSSVQQNSSATEERLKNNFNELKDITLINQNNQEKINLELNTFLNQYKVSAKKGQVGENIVQSILTDLYPSSEIIKTTKQTSMGDFILNRGDKPKILFENKNFDSMNVPKIDINKFIHDCTTNSCHGILMSQRTGIANKGNFEIEIINDNILIYIHNMENNPDKIKVAVDIIDNLYHSLKQINNKNGVNINISKNQMVLLNEQYQKLIAKKEAIINLLNENTKTVISNIRELEISELNAILSPIFSSTQITTLKCDICNTYVAANIRGLNNHKRKCSLKKSTTLETKTIKTYSSEDEDEDITEDIPENSTEDISEIHIEPSQIESKTKKTKSKKI